MKLGSLFDGIGAFPLAATRVGIEPVWAAEINPFGVKVTSHHFPLMNHVGDVTKLDGAKLEPVDIITGGSPCIGFSVSGLRQGLRDDRSGLFVDFIRIVEEMREATNGQHPTYVIWENVPGVFSSNEGADFENVIAAFVGADEPIPLPRDKRRNSGVVRRGNRTVQWRVLDARYFGVAQRRRRVFAVLYFGSEPRPEILFERKGSKWHINSSRKEGYQNPSVAREGVTWSLGSGKDTVGSLLHNAGTKQWSGNQEAFTGDFHLIQTRESEVAKTLLSEYGSASPRIGTDELIVQHVPKPALALTTSNQRNAIGQETFIAFAQNQRDELRDLNGTAGVLASQPGMKQQTFIAFTQSDHLQDRGEETAPMSRAKGLGGGSNGATVAYAVQTGHTQSNGVNIKTDEAFTLESNGSQAVSVFQGVRRLTPSECEILMAFPLGWTNFGSDSSRYAALGNSIVVNCLEWILSRLLHFGGHDRV